MRKKWLHRVLISLVVNCTKIRFDSLLSGGFTTMAIHQKRNTSVHCVAYTIFAVWPVYEVKCLCFSGWE